MNSRFVLIGLCLVAFTFSQGTVNAQVDSTWTGGGDGVSWFDVANWSNGVPNTPGFFNAFIDGNGGVNAAVDTGTFANISIDSLTLDAGDSLTIQNASDFEIVTNAGRPLSGRINNNGSIFVNSTGSNTDFLIETSVSLFGTGTLTLGGTAAQSRITSNGSNRLLTNSSTINGFGQVGGNRIHVTNQAGGLIDANSAGNTLTYDTFGQDFNAGTLRASNQGNLLINHSVVDNTAGTIEALNNSTVTLSSNTTITGGTLQTSGNGSIEVAGNARLYDLTLDGTVHLNNAANLYLRGTINNLSNINVTKLNTSTDINIDGDVTLAGGGTITLSGTNSQSRIVGLNFGGGHILTNVDNTIQGHGRVGEFSVGLVNQAGGLIDANDPTGGGRIWIDPADEGVTNFGTMRASNGGDLLLYRGIFTNHGIIEALDGSTVTISGASILPVEINGGQLRSSGTGSIELDKTIFPNTAHITLSDLTLGGTINQTNDTDVFLVGTINNQANYNITSSGDIVISGNTSLTGGGTITLKGTSNNSRINDDSDSDGVLTNVNNTIQGQGRVGMNTLQFINQAGGSIVANVDGQSLQIDPVGTSGGLINEGTLGASNGGTLDVFNIDILNEGIVDAGADSLVKFYSVFTNDVGGLLQGDGTIEVDGNFFNNGQIGPGASPGTLTLDVDQMVLSDTSELSIEIGFSGGQYDADFLQVIDTANLTLNGMLTVDLDGIIPTSTDSFTILSSQSELLGAFDNVANGQMLMTLGGEGSFTVVYGAGSIFGTNEVTLINFTPVPEPGSAALLLGMVCLFSVHRTRRSSS